jgi:hypothetical protein
MQVGFFFWPYTLEVCEQLAIATSNAVSENANRPAARATCRVMAITIWE